MSVLSSFADHALIASQQVGILLIEQMRTKEDPEYLRPRDDRVIEPLYTAVAAAFLCPARYTQHRDPPCHGDHRYDDPAHLPHACFRNAVLDRL